MEVNVDVNKEQAAGLAEEHWKYLRGVLTTHGQDVLRLQMVEFHYKSAFLHGYKHGVEDTKQLGAGEEKGIERLHGEVTPECSAGDKIQQPSPAPTSHKEGFSDNPIRIAYETLQEEMRRDPQYAWSWHCNIAMALQDGKLLSHKAANIAAAVIMEKVWRVRTEDSKYYTDLIDKE